MMEGFRPLLCFCRRVCVLLMVALSPAAGVSAAQAQPALDQLDEATVRREVETMFISVYRESWMKPGELRFEFQDMRILPQTMRKIDGGHYAEPIPVRPVKMTVKVIIDRRSNGIDTRIRGTGNYITPKETFYFYVRDGDWAFVTSSP